MSNIYVSQDVSFLVDDVLKRDVYKAYDFRLALIGNILPDIDITLKNKFSYVFEHFSPFTRLCCNPIVSNRMIENMAVIGKDKNTHEFIETVVPIELIGNFRLRQVHKPRLLEMIADSDWYYFENDSESFIEIANILLLLNPIYITHNGDRKYSLDTGENDDLKQNIDNAIEHGVPKSHPRLQHDKNELRMCGIGAAAAAGSIYHSGKKACKEIMDVDHWPKH